MSLPLRKISSLAAQAASHDEDDGNMAMDALNNLKTNISVWVNRLEELDGQIAQCRLGLAKLTESAKASSGSGASVVAKSVKNCGSTESLRPKNDPAAYPDDEQAGGDIAPSALEKLKRQTSQRAQPPRSPENDQQSKRPSALQRQTHQVMAVAQAKAKAKAMLQKRGWTDLTISNDNAPKCRMRSMINGYYDSNIQSSFEELLKAMSAAQNSIRKAKMAAKVAQIKKSAKLDMQDEEEEEERAQAEEQSNDPLTPATDSARYDKLEKGLEEVQRLCGHAAHQCLRDGDCKKDIESMKHRLKEMMDREIERVIERVSKEDPKAASMRFTTMSMPKKVDKTVTLCSSSLQCI